MRVGIGLEITQGGRAPGFGAGTVVALDFQRKDFGINGSHVSDPSLLPGWSFTRASVGMASDSAGNVLSFASGQPRSTDLGLLIEPAGTNNFQWSQAFDNVIWSKGAVSITPDAVVAPDGTTTADAMVEDGTTAAHQVFQNCSYVALSTNTVTVYVKPATRTQVYVSFASSYDASNPGAYFNLTGSGSVALTTGTGVPSITLVAGGFYRCSVTATSSTANTSGNFFIAGAVGSSNSYAGNSSTAFYLWQADMQPGSSIASPIRTVGATGTRAIDALTLTYGGSPTTATVLYGTNSSASPSAASPLNLGASSAGAWVGNYIRRVTVQ